MDRELEDKNIGSLGGISPDEFRAFGRAAVDFVADYIENIRDRPVLPVVEPGYLRTLIPDHAPDQPEHWKDVIKDLDRVIMPGITHWHSPSFHAYFPTGHSFPSIVGDIISGGLGVIGFSWLCSPACTELEIVVMDWLGKMLGLPQEFLNSSPGFGGGLIQGSASEATLVAMLAARERIVRQCKEQHPNMTENDIQAKLVAYTSDQSNSSVWKAGLLASIPMRKLPSDESGSFRGSTLKAAILSDRQKGLIPFYVVATLGTTGTCAFDNIQELGPLCKEEGLWLHIDAAYAGALFVCPEYRHLMTGVEFVDSFDMNPHKWMMVNFDCSAMWVKDTRELQQAFDVDAVYLKHHKQGVMPDLRHWQMPLGRRFRSLKLWMVLRTYGVSGMQAHVRKQVGLARQFERLVRSDQRFEVIISAVCGLVGFRIKGPEALTEQLLKSITTSRRLYMCPATVRGCHFLRFVVCSRLTEPEDILKSWSEIQHHADLLLGAKNENNNNNILSDHCNNTVVKPKNSQKVKSMVTCIGPNEQKEQVL